MTRSGLGTSGMFRNLTTAIRRWMHRPDWHEIEIARLTGEDPFDVYERIRDAALRTPFSILTVAAIEVARVSEGSRLSLVEMIDSLAGGDELR